MNKTKSKDGIEERKAMIKEAIELKKGEWPLEREFHKYYNYEDYEIGLFIPGKEAVNFVINKSCTKEDREAGRYICDYIWPNDTYVNKYIVEGKTAYKVKKTPGLQDKINLEDCAPIIKQKGKRISGPHVPESFKEIIFKICESPTTSEQAKEIGRLLWSMAYLEDHIEYKESYRYQPTINKEMKNTINCGELDVPLIVILYFLELIALNEDIKYHSGSFESKTRIPWKKPPTGRTNNLLTLIKVIGIQMFDNYRKDVQEAILTEYLKKLAKGITPKDYNKYFKV